MPVDDPNRYREQYKRELDRIEQAKPTDQGEIRAWGQSLTGEYSTRSDKIGRVRRLSERADTPLVDMDRADVLALLDSLETGSHPEVSDDGLGAGTIRNYRQAVRLFLRDQLGREWAEDITVGAPQSGTVDPEDLLTNEEVTALFDAATEPRDAALLGTLLAVGQRIAALLSLRVGDVDLSGRSGTIHLNDDALGLKGASGPRPLVWATGYMSNWLDVHPRADEDEAPLFCTLQGGEKPDPNGTIHEWERGDPLSRQQAHKRMKDIARDAGVPVDKVNPHNFRHTAITRMARDGVPEQKIKWLVGWAEDSTQFERYQHLTDEEMMNAFLEEYDLAEPDDTLGQPTIQECPRCSTPVRGEASFCSSCGLPLDQAAADTAEAAQSSITADMASLSEQAKRELAAETMDELLDDPEFRAAAVDEMADHFDHGSSP